MLRPSKTIQDKRQEMFASILSDSESLLSRVQSEDQMTPDYINYLKLNIEVKKAKHEALQWVLHEIQNL